ncbi:hypothetical protein GY21_10285 [Cryobacterium roopkundense]|uniref:DUF1772 domain-containing protein n=1 Tax=Cryobacterium roopkundense TaxID=1001240 RepID=A0A099JB00_9MICO|nr:hypothetical protein GY21_10285 [Cryobacterium roopkundense]
MRTVGASLAVVAVGITIVRNVPLNTALSRVSVASVGSSAAWNALDQRWSVANHARAAFAIASSVALMISLGGASP